jgi:hypothetical protein
LPSPDDDASGYVKGREPVGTWVDVHVDAADHAQELMN